ncbi:2-oxoglutarate dehydrogenase E1 component [Oceanobacillus saliphilus]|uniref:2-oxoglutarate dehydrogenase E1 component n=1 Tax=Oceanobacillus saliphilus TaxID=2925834 RepID=UPI00201D6BEF|nr:2-oxoglutarate dehydrogenase E1 component [Oceanobacillus saliphilus]
MAVNQANHPWGAINGPNLGYVFEQYDLYLENSAEVDKSFRDLFDQWDGPPALDQTDTVPTESPLSPGLLINKMKKLVASLELAGNIRKYGHLEANLYPLEKKASFEKLNLKAYNLSEEDLKEIPADFLCPENSDELKNGWDAVNYLQKIYTGPIAYEVEHMGAEEKRWLLQRIERELPKEKLSMVDKEDLLRSLYEAEGFEQFLQKMYVGQKRFSVEGLESMVPVINKLIMMAAEDNVKDLVISMAHRGRLNVLTHVLEKPYEAMFSQFQHSKWKNNDPSLVLTTGSTGDVKYHLGAVKKKQFGDKEITVTLANNPSHLEIAGTVAEGYARAAQDNRTQKGYSVQDKKKAVPLMIHGDAAFTGQGVVTEMLNYARTKAYNTGGTIHLIANNRIGFTTESEDDRSTHYPSDIVKGYGIPVIHVNADRPEACMQAIKLAFEYRQAFHKDVLVDIIGYRRMGHNEMDEPRSTNPLTYRLVDKHPTITAVYKEQLLSEKSMDETRMKEMETETLSNIQKAYDNLSEEKDEGLSLVERNAPIGKDLPKVDTSVDKETLQQMNTELLKWPDGFHVFGKLKKILNRRLEVFEKHKKIDWGHAEVLAFASILKDGTPIRITGQDTERGTFSHRNLVLSDSETGEKFSPLHEMSTSNASFDIHNSTLSEEAVLGFEYGYNVFSPETLVFWEAQFGDFANGAQVIFDQFIASGREKWGQKSGLVMLLPHGYEGQGPEHSSARLERFLQMAAENNWTVANLSTSANYFHILRRQAAILRSDEVRPLVIMSPKSLLRNASAGVFVEELTNGRFDPIIEQPGLAKKPEKIERIVFTTGRLAVELSDRVSEAESFDWLDIVRVEELYPFPEEEISYVLSKYKNLKEIVWSQEEPENMGAWTYIGPRLQRVAPDNMKVTYNGRPAMSSPSEGDPGVHKHEQERIIKNAITQSSKKKINKG